MWEPGTRDEDYLTEIMNARTAKIIVTNIRNKMNSLLDIKLLEEETNNE